VRVCYFDCISGISGDMVLGALLDAGLSLASLIHHLSKLAIDGWTIEPVTVTKAGLRATLAEVTTRDEHHHRHYHDIAELLESSDIDPKAVRLALTVFRRLGEAEAKVHGVELEDVHFHEVGATDSIIDIVGSCIGLVELGIDAVFGSPLPWTHGTVRAAHGVMPIPAPATAELMRNWPVYSLDLEGELVTPTGAAILTALAEPRLPDLTPELIGYGAGHKDLGQRPNVLRAVIGNVATSDLESDSVVEIECNLDDSNPEWIPQAMQLILEAGAVDVYLTPITMKKGRPGFKITALAPAGAVAKVSTTILKHTTSLGVRYHELKRLKLRRDTRLVETPWGPVKVKEAYLDGQRVNAAPEYEDCQRLSESSGVPLKQIYAAAMCLLDQES